jgi:hypothetical protein
MKASEYNEIDNTFFLIEEKTKVVCKENNVNYYNYIGTFKILLNNYATDKKYVEIVKDLDFNDLIATRAILNKKHFSSKESEIILANKKLEISKKKLFDWLDKTKTPYFFILNPIFSYGAGIDYNGFGYKKERFTGIENTNIACDYAIYKLKI